jgi:hypothetical protein
MPVTQTYDPVRPLRAPDGGAAYCSREVLGPDYLVHYGESHWPSRSWLLLLALDQCPRESLLA